MTSLKFGSFLRILIFFPLELLMASLRATPLRSFGSRLVAWELSGRAWALLCMLGVPYLLALVIYTIALTRFAHAHSLVRTHTDTHTHMHTLNAHAHA